MTAHPRARLDDLVHQPVRFSLLAGLAQADELEFRFLRDTLQISDSLLSRQASTLEQAGYIAIRKGHVGKWPRTWLKLTPEGRTAFNDHLNTLREIVETRPVSPSDRRRRGEKFDQQRSLTFVGERERMMGLEPTTFCMAKGTDNPTPPDATDEKLVITRKPLRGVVRCKALSSRRT